MKLARVLAVLGLVHVLAAGLSPCPAAAEIAARLDLRSLVAQRATGEIRLDGVLDEPAWAAAMAADDFVQEEPRPGEAARLATRFRVVFDDRALYVGIRLDDPTAGAIQAPLGRRDDENSSDWCYVEIDSRRDRRTGFSFGVNPAGMQVDGVFYDDTHYDVSWNAVWEAVTRVDASGWTIEYRIPFSVLAFERAAAGAPMRWGINVYRYNPHLGEVANWSPRMPALAGVVSRFNELVVAAAPEVHRFDVTPYALLELDGTGSPGLRAGADVSVGITPGLGLAATVRPDFGQVEADPTQLNLTSFELFQQERRPFFTEGATAFRFDTTLPLVTRGDSFAEEAAFYSRRIGRPPEGDVPAGATAPPVTDLLGAAKLFGAASGWRIGALAAVTGPADATGPAGATPVAATTATAVARVVRESGDGNAAVGVFASALHRDVDGALADALVRDELALGVDARRRWREAYEARAWVLATEQLGSAAAIDRLALAPWHNFGRSDAPRLRLDDGATRLTGIAAEARLAKVSGDLQASLAARAISPGFDVNGIGFQRNSDWVLLVAQWSYAQVASSWVRQWKVGTDNAGLGWSWGGERRAAVASGYLRLDLASYWDATLTLQHELEALSTEWLRGGPALALPPRERARLVAHTDMRRTTFATLDAEVALEPGSRSRRWAVAPAATVRISDHLAGTLGASYADERIGWQLVAGPGAAPADTYLVGSLRQRTVALSLQADLALSPRLIVQLYAQPFATVGRYDRYAVLADPRAARPSDRFTRLAADQLMVDDASLTIRGDPDWTVARPDAAQRTVVASAVVRWEVRPGSYLTAVWNHHAERTEATAMSRPWREVGRAIVEPGADVVLIKLGWRWAPWE